MHGSNGFFISDVHFSYGPQPCLHDISLSLEPGLFYGLIGPNGSGKSTLLDLLSGYLQPDSGTITLNGRLLESCRRSDLARLLTVVPQSFSFNFDFDVYQTVMMGRHPHIARFSSPQTSDHDQVAEALRLLGIEQLACRSIRKLSGGEKQRVMIARALAQDTAFILLDEVTANLDINHAIAIMQTLKKLVSGGKTVIAALHDLNMALAFCDKVMVLDRGGLQHFGRSEEIINPQVVSDIYQVSAELVRIDDNSDQLFFNYR